MSEPKFVSPAAKYLYGLTYDSEIGSPSDIGWHSLYLGDLADGEGFDTLTPDVQEQLRQAAAAILHEDTTNTVNLELFDSEKEAKLVWEDIEDDYDEFFESGHTASKKG